MNQFVEETISGGWLMGSMVIYKLVFFLPLYLLSKKFKCYRVK